MVGSLTAGAPNRIALLRAVNLGGYGKLPMAELRAALTEAGLAEVRTLLASGNVVFRDPRRPEALEPLIEAVVRERFGLTTEVYVRTPGEWAEVVAGCPFPEAARHEPSRLVALICRQAFDAGRLAEAQGAVPGPERLGGSGRTLYMHFGEGMADSKVTPAWLRSRLRAHGTGRNWNTVLKLAAMVAV